MNKIKSKDLYDLAKESCHQAGFPWTDPRTLVTYPPQSIKRAQAKLIALSVCQCGFPLLNDLISLGTKYEVDPYRIQFLDLLCGGCGRWHRHIKCMWVYERGLISAGYLPAKVFKVNKQSTKRTKQ